MSEVDMQVDGKAGSVGFRLGLYPLYDEADLDGQTYPVRYREAGWREGRRLVLRDTRRRLPQVRLHPAEGIVRYRSGQDNAHGAAYVLEVESASRGREAVLTLTLDPNPNQAPRRFPDVPEAQTALCRMSDAVLATVRKTAVAWPAVAGLVPNTYRLDPLEPFLREANYAAGCYMPRVVMLLTAASLASRDARYVDGAFDALEKYRQFCRILSDGRIGYASGISPSGEVEAAWEHHPRPSDYAIAARGYLYVADACSRMGAHERARLALARAKELSLALAVLRGPDGCFSSRYSYQDPRWTQPGVAVNNVSWVLWQVQERLAAAGDPAAARVRQCALDYVAFELDRRPGPSALRVPGPGTAESIPMYHDDFATLACHLIVRHLHTGEARFLELAGQASACAIFAASNFHFDQPEAFGFPISQGKLPVWLGGVVDTVGKGGMQDKSGNEVLLALARRFGDALSARALEWRWRSRLAWSLEPSGGMNNMDIRVPGYSYRNTEWAEELNWGGVGFAAHHLLASD